MDLFVVAGRINRRLEAQPRAVPLLLAGVLLLVVFALDYVTTNQIHFTFFYLVPVFISSWYLGLGAGLTAAALSTVSWYAADSLNQGALASLWNLGVVFGIFAANAFSAAKLKRDKLLQREASAQLRAARARIAELEAESRARERRETKP
ncbi:MAG TPA: hypothetical protein VNI01_05615 [Elusimicrobiota bacterium]|nr:hypothetical protein [Elusimicrobiota bacterium]